MNYKFKKCCLSVVSVLFLLCAMLHPAQLSAGDPDLNYLTIHTEHFTIHFHQGLKELAIKSAALAEEIHTELIIALGWEVDGPTDIVIMDSTDSANGMATAFVRPQITLYATKPTTDSALAHHGDWLRTLITHEYTHIIHLQMHWGLARIINTIFGNVYLPNQIQPRWFIEGLAVMNETYRTSFGRIRSAYYRMVIRTHALEGKLQTLGEASNPTVDYPRGQADYIYGAMFMNYLRTRFGEEKIFDICHEYGGELLPYGMNRVFKRVLKTDLNKLYKDWQNTVIQQTKQTKKEIEKQGVTKTTRLTFDGESKGKPIFTLDGKSLLVPANNGKIKSVIYKISLNTQKTTNTRIVLSNSNSRVSLDNLGQMYYTRTAPHKNIYRFNDVFVLDKQAKNIKRITHGKRCREAEISKSGNKIAMVTNKNGLTSLVITDENGHNAKTLIKGTEQKQIYDPAWSPDEKRIAFILRENHQADIAIIDIETSKITKITDDLALEVAPVFSPSGQYLLFSSDRSGISNIYSKDLKNGNLYQNTNIVSGAIYPAISPDEKTIAFLMYSSIGWDIYTAPFNLGSNNIAKPFDDLEKIKPRKTPSIKTLKIVPYNPLPSFLPRAWSLGFANTGAQYLLSTEIAMKDAVGYHSLGMQFNHNLTNNTPSVSASYGYYGMKPGFNIGFSRTTVQKENGYLVGGQLKPWDKKIISGYLGLSTRVRGLDRNHSLGFAYTLSHSEPTENLDITIDPNGALPNLPIQYFRAGLQFSWSFNNTESSVWGVSIEKGRIVNAKLSFYNPAFGGNQNLATFTYGWREYLRLPWTDHHVLALNISGGAHISSPPGQAAFSTGGYREQDIIDSMRNNTPTGVPSLRGYPVNSFYGDQVHSLKLEYRFPVWWAEKAYSTLPLFFRRLNVGVFTDNVMTTFDQLAFTDWRSSVGAELVWSMFFGYYMPVTLRTGYARGLMHGGTNEVILIMGGTY